MANGIVLNIDTTKSEFQNPMVQLRQGDGNYQSLTVTVTSNGEPFDLTGWTTTFMGTTAGGFKIVDTASVITNASQGQFTYTPPKSWGQDQGEFKNAYFKFTKADETASGASFRVNVLDAVDLTAEEAKDYISVVDVMIDQVKTDMDNKLSETKQTLADTQSQAQTVQTNVDDLNANVNNLKTQNLNIKKTDNTWTGTNTFNNKIIAPAGVQGPMDLSQITIGGRNLLLNTKSLWTDGIGNNGNITVTVEPFDSNTNMWHLVAPQQAYNNAGIYFYNGVIQPGDNWALSFDVKGTGNWSYNGARIENSTVTKSVEPLTTNWTRVSSTGKKVSTGGAMTFYFNLANSPLDVYIKLPKLEVGKLPTDWTPAPEDVPSNDSNLVHKTGNETIAGNKTFTGNTNLTGSTTLQNGNYGLRVTTSGVQKTSDGGTTWVNI